MQHNPDFATLSEAAYEAADRLVDHLAFCSNPAGCVSQKDLAKDYRTKRDDALKALRKSKPLRGSSAKGGR